jgi:hypothetical protein
LSPRAKRSSYALGTTMSPLSALANVASDSPWENYVHAPVAILLAALCVDVARTASRLAPRGSDTRLSIRGAHPANS